MYVLHTSTNSSFYEDVRHSNRKTKVYRRTEDHLNEFDYELRIRDIVARWSGSAHDDTILNNTHLKQRFEAGHFRNKLFVGDAGYQLLPYLLKKLQNINFTAENLYNESLIRTRNVMER
nr:unnamed protein product [Callosobruchus analis]